jgi:uncharacterized integral membrane protein
MTHDHPPIREARWMHAEPRPAAAADGKPGQRDRVRLTVAATIGALATLFAALNFGDVDVNWILGTHSTPLILVMAVWFLLGLVTGRVLLVRRRAKARRARRAG